MTAKGRGSRSVRVDQADAGAAEAALATARTVAAGALASGMVHEFANLLTVVDGLRQMAALGRPLDDAGRLLAAPSERCQELIESFRRAFSEPAAADVRVPVGADLEALHPLVRARLRGRSTQFESRTSAAAAEASIPADVWVPARTAVLCVLLSFLEHARAHEHSPARARLSAEREADGAFRLGAELRGIGSATPQRALAATSGQLLDAARALAAACRFELDVAWTEQGAFAHARISATR